METKSYKIDFFKMLLVCSLPMRNGNKTVFNQVRDGRQVCSLPMRNGNKDSVGAGVYEQDEVCSLPMRNGNMNDRFCIRWISSFVAYL